MRGGRISELKSPVLFPDFPLLQQLFGWLYCHYHGMDARAAAIMEKNAATILAAILKADRKAMDKWIALEPVEIEWRESNEDIHQGMRFTIREGEFQDVYGQTKMGVTAYKMNCEGDCVIFTQLYNRILPGVDRDHCVFNYSLSQLKMECLRAFIDAEHRVGRVADLSEIDLCEFDISSSCLTGADFKYTRMRSVHFRELQKKGMAPDITFVELTDSADQRSGLHLIELPNGLKHDAPSSTTDSRTMNPITDRQMAHAIQNVADNRPAHITSSDWNIGRAILRFFYSLTHSDEFPADLQDRQLSEKIAAHAPQILKAMASIDISHTHSARFQIGTQEFNFCQRKNRVFLRNESGVEICSFGKKTPRELQCAGLKALLEYGIKNTQTMDLDGINLATIENAHLLDFSAAQINYQAIDGLSDSEPSPGKLINLRGATFAEKPTVQLFQFADETSTADQDNYLQNADWARFLIDKQLACDLIRAKANPQKIFVQYLASERAMGEIDVDISGFDLTAINLKGLDLRGLKLTELLENGDPLVLKNLGTAQLDRQVRGKLITAAPAKSIVTDAAVLSPRPLHSNTSFQFRPEHFVALGKELHEMHHAKKPTTLGGIDFDNVRLIKGKVCYLHRSAPDQASVSADQRADLSEEELRALNTPREERTDHALLQKFQREATRDQYEFFGTVMKALFKKAELDSYCGDYHAAYVDDLLKLLPCDATLKEDLFQFLNDRGTKELHYPLYAYLLPHHTDVDSYLMKLI